MFFQMRCDYQLYEIERKVCTRATFSNEYHSCLDITAFEKTYARRSSLFIYQK